MPERTAAQVDQAIRTVAGLNEIAVPDPLQRILRAIPRRHDVQIGMQFVRAGEFARACHRDGMVPVGAAFSRKQVVPTVALVEMRRFSEAEGRAVENVHPFTDELALLYRVFLQHDAGEAIVSRAMVPKHVQQVLPAIVVVKERWIEAAAVEINRIGPVAVDARAGHKVVVEVAHGRTARQRCGPASPTRCGTRPGSTSRCASRAAIRSACPKASWRDATSSAGYSG